MILKTSEITKVYTETEVQSRVEQARVQAFDEVVAEFNRLDTLGVATQPVAEVIEKLKQREARMPSPSDNGVASTSESGEFYC